MVESFREHVLPRYKQKIAFPARGEGEPRGGGGFSSSGSTGFPGFPGSPSGLASPGLIDSVANRYHSEKTTAKIHAAPGIQERVPLGTLAPTGSTSKWLHVRSFYDVELGELRRAYEVEKTKLEIKAKSSQDKSGDEARWGKTGLALTLTLTLMPIRIVGSMGGNAAILGPQTPLP